MKRVLVTGAGGFIGRGLAARLAVQRREGRIDALTLVDLHFSDDAAVEGVRKIRGDLGRGEVLHEALAERPDVVFHLAGITSRQAEEDFGLGLRVNVTDTVALFEGLRAQAQCPVVVYGSSIGVHGAPLPAAIDDGTPPAPALSYGAQKRMVEILLADYSRRGWLDGRSVRLPSVVARPAQPGGALSSFASDLIREIAEGRSYECPVDASATLWLLSLPACIACLLDVAAAEAHPLPAGRAWHLPALRARVGEIADALVRRFGPEVHTRLSFRPDASLQAQFGRWPPLATPVADRLGLQHDGDLDILVERALADGPSTRPQA